MVFTALPLLLMANFLVSEASLCFATDAEGMPAPVLTANKGDTLQVRTRLPRLCAPSSV